MGAGHKQGVTTERQDFENLFRTHYAALTKYALRRVGPDAAPEVVSETFLTAWRRFADLPSDEPLPWLYATARRVIANEYRRRSRFGRLSDRVVGTFVDDDPDHADEVVARVHVRKAMQRLSTRDREALMLAEWEQLAPAEAAKVLGCSTATYRVRLHRARQRIATLLDDDDGAVAPPRRVVAIHPTGEVS